MKRVEKYGDMLIRGLTLPVRIVVGIVNAVEKNMPDTLEFPYEVKKRSVSIVFSKTITFFTDSPSFQLKNFV